MNMKRYTYLKYKVGNFPGNINISRLGREIVGNSGKYWEIPGNNREIMGNNREIPGRYLGNTTW